MSIYNFSSILEGLYEQKNDFIKETILSQAKGTSLEMSEYYLKYFYYYVDELCYDAEDWINTPPTVRVIFKPIPVDDILVRLGEIPKEEKEMIDKKMLKIYNRKVKNMGFTIKDLKELIADAPDNLPVEVIGRYVSQDDMVMTDIGIDDKSLWFELGYEFDRAGYLK